MYFLNNERNNREKAILIEPILRSYASLSVCLVLFYTDKFKLNVLYVSNIS